MQPKQMPDFLFKKSRGGTLTWLQAADRVTRGLPKGPILALKEALALTSAELAERLGVSVKTLSRVTRGHGARLKPLPSDRLLRMARILTLARDVLEDDPQARDWLRRPQFGLGGRVPLDLLATDAGTREVEDLLWRIEYGILS